MMTRIEKLYNQHRKRMAVFQIQEVDFYLNKTWLPDFDFFKSTFNAKITKVTQGYRVTMSKSFEKEMMRFLGMI